MSEEGWQFPGPVRRALDDLAAWVLYVYLVALPVSFGLGWLSGGNHTPFRMTLAVSAVLFCGLGFMVFMWLAYEEDWWDDFREQNRAMVMFALLHLVGLPAAWAWGRSIGG